MPQHHGRRSSTQLTLQAAFSQTAFQVLPTATGPIDVVDLFCGVGGFSEGARLAGHRVVLAIDSNKSALDAHKLNHPSAVHELVILPAENLQQLLPSAGTKWHLHGSPPCTKLSRAGGTNRSAADRAEGLFLVNWFWTWLQRLGVQLGPWNKSHKRTFWKSWLRVRRLHPAYTRTMWLTWLTSESPRSGNE